MLAATRDVKCTMDERSVTNPSKSLVDVIEKIKKNRMARTMQEMKREMRKTIRRITKATQEMVSNQKKA